MNSDTQSNSLFDLIGTLGTAYFGAEAVKAATNGQQTGTINSVGKTTTTPVADAAPAAQILPGVDNKMLFIGGGLVIVLGVVLIAMRSR